jgi:two-component system, LuxR family, response regulator TtrR
MNPMNLNLYVVDDDEAVRRSYGALLLARGHTVRLFESGEAFLASADLRKEGCVILDLRMDGMSGLQVFEELRRRASPLVVLFLSGHGDIATAVEAVQGGAFGWLEKPCDEARLMQEIRKALDQAALQAQKRRAAQHGLTLWATLTEREREVAPLVAEGKSSKMIARLLRERNPGMPINHRTVETHRGRIFDKLIVANSNELLIFLQEHGLYALQPLQQQ